MQRKDMSQQVIPHPPALANYQVTHSTRLRFTVTAAADTPIGFANLLDAMLVAATATTGFRLFTVVKVKDVEVWASPLLGTTVSVGVAFTSVTAGFTGDQVIRTDTSMGIQPAHVKAKPSLKSLASDFQGSTAAIAFIVQAPAGSVVDVAVTYKSTFNNAVGVSAALVGANAGAIYLRGLDGLAIATTNFPPVLLPSAGTASI